ncbi:hypothetical protein GCM10008959_07130 [Deinococcus seoulensis]|uniref:Uncharacterized protein n=2 Tax=Deinococcus TaxID=1298 RepID=A0ABQ2RRP5_9DEIO|nr:MULTISPECIES: hypothetical protein [Deinococcus]GGR48585.1 hypothetical protein GCM10008959_07130 [Deinococcus seoulensis]GGS19805.1 hypothetical protein GCM10008961_09240 [Deinococcus knuensis]
MTAFLLFILIPTALIVLSFRMKPVVPPDESPHDALGGGLAATGLFGGHGLPADVRSVPEETAPVRFDLSGLPERE